MNLRARAITDLKTQNVKNWGLPVVLIDPDGVTYNTDNETGETLKAVQILYDYRRENPDTGEPMIIKEPVVVLALSSLARRPVESERWVVKIPLDPTDESTLTTFFLSSDRAIEGSTSIGFIRLYPQKAQQS